MSVRREVPRGNPLWAMPYEREPVPDVAALEGRVQALIAECAALREECARLWQQREIFVAQLKAALDERDLLRAHPAPASDPD